MGTGKSGSSLPNDVNFSEKTSNLSTLPILYEPAVMYKIYLPPLQDTCPLTFHDNEKYGLPYIKSIYPLTPIGQQLPVQALKQQWVLGIRHEEPIRAASAQDEFLRL